MSARRSTSPPADAPDVDLTAIAARFATETDTPARPTRQVAPGTSTVVLVPLGHEAPTTVMTVSTEQFVSESTMSAPAARTPGSVALGPTIPAAWLAASATQASPRRSQSHGIALAAVGLLACALVTTFVEGNRRPKAGEPTAAAAAVTTQASIVSQAQWPFAPLRAGIDVESSGATALTSDAPLEAVQPASGDPVHLPLPTADVSLDAAPLRVAELASRDVPVASRDLPVVSRDVPVVPASAASAPPAEATAPAGPIAARPVAIPASAASSGAEAPRGTDTSLITGLLDGYRGAFNDLDASAARAVWPTVNHRALDRAFGQLAQQEITFDDCQIDLEGPRAAATCRGVARYVPKVGSRRAQTATRQWSFNLQKIDDRWTIEDVATR